MVAIILPEIDFGQGVMLITLEKLFNIKSALWEKRVMFEEGALKKVVLKSMESCEWCWSGNKLCTLKD